MKLYRITLPQNDNEGRCIGHIHDQLASDLIAIAGGFTRTTGVGFWKDEDRIQKEYVYIYEVAYDREALAGVLRARAIVAAQDAGQKALYIVDGGVAEIITL